jgi:hypothetical protein
VDAFFKYFVGRIEASAQAYRIANSEGRKGADMDKRIKSLVGTPGSAAWVLAVRQAEEMTFQQDLPSLIQTIQDLKNKERRNKNGQLAAGGMWETIGRTILRFNFPFIKTPYNIISTALRKTPLGSLNMMANAGTAVWQMKNGTPFIESYSKAKILHHAVEQFIAWTSFALIYGLSEGDPDDDKKGLMFTGTRAAKDDRAGEKAMLARTRGGATMVLYNGTPVFNYGRYEPFATILSSMVDASRAIKKAGRGKAATDMAAAIIGNIADQAESKTFLQGIENLSRLYAQIRNPDKIGHEMAGALIKGIVPNIIRQPLRNMDEYARDTKHAPLIYSAFPFGGLAEPLYDLYGRPVQKTGNPLSRLVMASGTDTSRKTTMAPDAALNKWNAANPIEPYYPSPDINHRYKDALGKWHEMTPAEIALQRREGGKNMLQMAAISPGEAMAPTKATVQAIQKARNKAFSDTRNRIFAGGTRPVIPPKRNVSLAEMMGWNKVQ